MYSTASGIFNSVTSSGRGTPEENSELEPSLTAESPPEVLKPSESSPTNVDNTLEDLDVLAIENAKTDLEPDSVAALDLSKNSDDVLAPGVGEKSDDSKLEDLISPSFVHTASGEGSSGGNSGSENFEINTDDPGMSKGNPKKYS